MSYRNIAQYIQDSSAMATMKSQRDVENLRCTKHNNINQL